MNPRIRMMFRIVFVFCVWTVLSGEALAFSDEESENLFIPALARAPSTTDMILIPAGTFQMGCDESIDSCDSNELPLHTVFLSSYYIDKYTVTNAEYEACVNAGVCTIPVWTGSYSRDVYYGSPSYADYPVIRVTWYQANTYCEWEGKRLLTEAEWEKAARGPSDTRIYPWGNAKPTCDLANGYLDGYCVGDTTPVNGYQAGVSPYGVVNMLGNIWEWVNDWYEEEYYSASPGVNPTGPQTGTQRVMRGGSWVNHGKDLRITYRLMSVPRRNTCADFGIRCALSP